MKIKKQNKILLIIAFMFFALSSTTQAWGFSSFFHQEAQKQQENFNNFKKTHTYENIKEFSGGVYNGIKKSIKVTFSFLSRTGGYMYACSLGKVDDRRNGTKTNYLKCKNAKRNVNHAIKILKSKGVDTSKYVKACSGVIKWSDKKYCSKVTNKILDKTYDEWEKIKNSPLEKKGEYTGELISIIGIKGFILFR